LNVDSLVKFALGNMKKEEATRLNVCSQMFLFSKKNAKLLSSQIKIKVRNRGRNYLKENQA